MVNCQDDDITILIAKKFILYFESGVCVIKHWRIHNLIRGDRYTETQWIKEKDQLLIDEKTNKYSLNKGLNDVIPNGNQMAPQVRLGKVRLGKVSNEDKTSSKTTKVVNEIDLKLAGHLLSKIKENTPTFRQPNLDTWADHIRLMREIDERTYEQIEIVITWCQQDNFWQANILSTKKLREKFDTLVSQMKRVADKEKIKKINVIL